jgi:poly(beta-D-mannuronate) lyase
VRLTFVSACLLVVLPVCTVAQQVKDPHASLADIAAQSAALAGSASLKPVIASLPSCVKTEAVAPPSGRIIIPHHYLNGSNGPTNPAEAEATRIYTRFEIRITAGMNQYVATGSHAESACALAQLDSWAQAGALLDYDAVESSQAWFQVEWTLSSAGVTNSVLVTDATLDPTQQHRVTAWLDKAARRNISFERPGRDNNNHHYWRALAATSIGIAASDDKLFRFGVDTYKEAIADLDPRGAFPKEMARHENAIHYQGFALAPLVLIAQFASRQGIDLYSYPVHGRTLRDAIIFFGRAAADPSLVKPYTSEQQRTNFGAGDFAPFALFIAHSGSDGLPPNVIATSTQSAFVTRIGGNMLLFAAK